MCWSAVGTSQQQQQDWGATVGTGCTNQIGVKCIWVSQVMPSFKSLAPNMTFKVCKDVETQLFEVVVCVWSQVVTTGFSKLPSQHTIAKWDFIDAPQLDPSSNTVICFYYDLFLHRHQNISASLSVVVLTILTTWHILTVLLDLLVSAWVGPLLALITFRPNYWRKKNRFDLIYTTDL